MALFGACLYMPGSYRTSVSQPHQPANTREQTTLSEIMSFPLSAMFLVWLGFSPAILSALLCHVSYLVWLFTRRFVRFILPFFFFVLAILPPFFRFILPFLIFGLGFSPAILSTLLCHFFIFGLAIFPPFQMFSLGFLLPSCPLYSAIFLICFSYSFSQQFFLFTLPFIIFGLAFLPPFCPLYSYILSVLLLGKAIPTPFCPFFITMLLIGFGYSTHSCYCFLLLIKMYLVFTIFYRPQIDIYCIYGAHRSNGHIKHLGSSCVHCVQSPGICASLSLPNIISRLWSISYSFL